MGESSSAASKSTVVDAIVLAFAHSDASEIVGTDALRSVLSVEYHDMMGPEGLDLTGLLELLEQQPGFKSEMAVPPMCSLKSWESQLGLAIMLPEALGELSEKDVALNAASCGVPSTELKRVLRAASAQAKPKRVSAAKHVASAQADDKRLVKLIASIVVAVVCFGFVTFQILGSMSGSGDWKSISPGTVSGLEVSSAERFADQVGVTITNPSWYALPEDTKKEQLRAALNGLRNDGVKVLFVQDSAKRVRATVQGSSDTMSFTFQ